MVSSRYLSQELFDGFGQKGQQKLLQSRVLLVGCGALGSNTSELMSRAGVGFLRLVDGDQVELANLHRQLLYTEEDASMGRLKVYCAKERLEKVNSEIEYDIYDEKFTEENGRELAENIDIIMDCTDNPEARRAIDKIAREVGIPWVYGGVAASVGMAKFVAGHKNESINSWFDFESGEAMFSPCQDGVLNTIPSLVSNIQCTEAFKYLTDNEEKITGNLFYIDLWKSNFDVIELADPEEVTEKV